MAKKNKPKKGKRKVPRKRPAPPVGGRPREIDRKEVVRLHRQGLSGKAIAREMNTSPRSVRRILDDLGEPRRSAAVDSTPATADSSAAVRKTAPDSAPPSAPGYRPPNLPFADTVISAPPGAPRGAVNRGTFRGESPPGRSRGGKSGAQDAPSGANGGAIPVLSGSPEGQPRAQVPLSPAALAAWRHQTLQALARRYLPGDMPPVERAESLRALEVLLARCSPEARPLKSEVQAALAGPLGPYLERRRRAEEALRRETAFRLVTERLPTDMPREDFPATDEAIEALLAGRPEATAEQVAEEILISLYAASRRRKQRKAALETARREVELVWDREVILLEPEQREALNRHWQRTFEARDQTRIDFLSILESEEKILPVGGRIARLVRERLAALLKEVLPR